MNNDNCDLDFQAQQPPSTLSKVVYWLLLAPGSVAISGIIAIIIAVFDNKNPYTAIGALITVLPIVALLNIFGFFIFNKTNKRLIITNTIFALITIPLLILANELM